jgi:hypothetical protein
VDVTLSAVGSVDADGDIVDYRWIRTDIPQADRHGSADGISGEVGRSPNVTLSLLLGKHRFSLFVTDDDGSVGIPATVTVSIVSAEACKAAYDAVSPGNAACTECLCKLNSEGGCRDQISNCFGNPDPDFTSQCSVLNICALMTGCESAACYEPANCMAELDVAIENYGGWPGGCIDFDAAEAPCPASVAVGECRVANCAAECM